MKTLITLCIVLAVSICTAQEPTEKVSNLFTPEQVEQLKETLSSLSEKLKNSEGAIFTKEEATLIMQKLQSTQEQLAKSTVFTKTIKTATSPTSHTKVKYSITFDEEENPQVIADLKNLDLKPLSDTLAEFVVALQDSPKIKELSEKMEQVHEKIKVEEKN